MSSEYLISEWWEIWKFVSLAICYYSFRITSITCWKNMVHLCGYTNIPLRNKIEWMNTKWDRHFYLIKFGKWAKMWIIFPSGDQWITVYRMIEQRMEGSQLLVNGSYEFTTKRGILGNLRSCGRRIRRRRSFQFSNPINFWPNWHVENEIKKVNHRSIFSNYNT